MAEGAGGSDLRCVTWNIAAINNNPFEYYLTLEGEDGGYAVLMQAVQALIDTPGAEEPKVSQVFTDAMWKKLKQAMLELGWEGIPKVEERWTSDLSGRRIVTDFLKDKDIGSKRLASMPDRVTNTINCFDGSIVCRPTIINNYTKAMQDEQDWFRQWFNFMFVDEVTVKTGKDKSERKRVCHLLQPITKAKYEAVTDEEEAMSLPLQLLCLAIFDAVLLHLVGQASRAGADGQPINWQAIKERICTSLVVNKAENTLRVLIEQPSYAEADLIFLQEASGAFIDSLKQRVSDRFVVLVPEAADYVRDQNSVILVSRRRIPEGSAAPLECALAMDDGPVKVANGDVCAFTVPLVLGGTVREVLVGSFHGDTNGLASTPVVNAVRAAAFKANLPVIMGLDANTHRAEAKGTKYVGSFLDDLKVGDGPLAHTWSGTPEQWITTCNARSYLQPQLNKAVPFADRMTSKLTDRNPKDYILFSQHAFSVKEHAKRDNTGTCSFADGIDLPTLKFPSDHAIVVSCLTVVPPA